MQPSSAKIKSRITNANRDKIPRLNFDSLEPRHLLAGISYDSATRVVTVEGSQEADHVQVLQESTTDIRVQLGGVDSQVFEMADVTEVHFFARAGDDWFRNHTDVSSRVFGHEGNDLLIGGSGIDELHGGDDDDRILGGDGGDSLFGDAGDDFLFGGNGDDFLVGHDGDDQIFAEAGDDLVIAGGGNDRVDGGWGNDEIFGNEGNDRLLGNEGDDAIAGQEGDDVVFGNAGNDSIQGNDGVDQLLGGTGDDSLLGGNDNDTLFGQSGKDSIRGGVGDDWISGGDQDDKLFGNDGNDTLRGDDGDDRIWSGRGDDRASGNDGNDTMLGESGNDRIWGNAGADLLFGNEGDDNVDGGSGDDVVLGNDGNDNLFGDDGQDQVFGNLGDDFVSGGTGKDRLFGHEGRDIIFGGSGNDFMLGQAGADFLAGQDDDDEIYGGTERDTLRGGFGNDRLFGQEGEDNLDGENDNDIVHGGDSRDVLKGGEGDDDIYSDLDDDVRSDDQDEQKSAQLPMVRPVGLSNRLTVSFAPDGTSIFDQTSQLFSAFDGMFSAQQIQDTLLNGFGAWAQHGNLDIGFVADSGDAFGVPGSSYGDSRFGDVRIGAMPMASDVYAIAMGQGDFVTGTWAGDILFNSNANFQDADHFFAVALHEVGHVLGLKHTNNLGSVMHRYSNLTELPPVDIATFQDLYGIRSLDANDDDDDESINNDTSDRATEIKIVDDKIVPGTYPSIVFGDISIPSDVDFYEIETPDDYTGQLTIQVVSEGISQLAPTVSLLDKDDNLITQVDSAQPHGDIITISTSALLSEGKFYLKIDSGMAGLTGSFSVIATLDDRNSVDSAFTLGVAQSREFVHLDQEDLAKYFADPADYLFNEDGHGDDEIGSATELKTEDGFELESRFHYQASLLDSEDVDTYLFKSMKTDAVKPLTMNISVRSIELGGMIPKATIHDKNGVEIPSQVVVNGHGEYVIQVEQYPKDTEYYLFVSSDNLLPFNSGNYELTISYSATPVVFHTYAQGTIDSGNKQYHSLHVAESQVIQFAFDAEELPTSPDAMVWATIYDQDGSIVYRTMTRSGERRTASTAFFKPGSYTIEIENAVGSSFDGLKYEFIGIDVGGPQGPVFSDPSDSPFDVNPEGEYVYPDNVVTKLNFVIVDGISSNQTDPPADDPPSDLFDWYWELGI